MFEVISDLRVGRIVEVSGSSIRIELDGAITELTRTFGGRVYSIGQFGSIIKIHFGRRLLFAYVRLLRMRSELELELGLQSHTSSEDSRIIDADLFGEGTWSEQELKFDFQRGLKTYPLPGQIAFLTTNEELQVVYQGASQERLTKANALIAIGVYVSSQETICYANADKFFSQHSAILGSTGSGKSATVAAIVHSAIDHVDKSEIPRDCLPKIIIIDPHGEYTKAFGPRATVYSAYSNASEPAAPVQQQLKLPYWLLSGEEVRELIIAKTQEEATSENNIIYKALAHARLVQRGWIEGAKDWIGIEPKGNLQPDEPRPIKDHAKDVQNYDRDTPDPFTWSEFVSHIRKEQGVHVTSGKWSQMPTSNFKSHAQVLDKLSVLRNDPRMNFMMEEYSSSSSNLAEILQQFIGSPAGTSEEASIKVIDISGLPNEVAGPVTAAIARLLFQYKVWQTRAEREGDPVLFICEEAHRYVPDHGRAEYETAQKAVRRIAKEGRKYGIGLMLVSQRPSDVERTVLSQCNSWIVMRLTNPTDQEHVASFLPDSLQGLVKMLPALSRREALFVGEAAAIPARIMINNLSLDKLPDSHDIDFMSSWHKPVTSISALEIVTQRWTRSQKPDHEKDKPS